MTLVSKVNNEAQLIFVHLVISCELHIVIHYITTFLGYESCIIACV